MAKKYNISSKSINDSLVGLQFTSDGGTPLFTLGNFKVETTFSEKVDKTYNVGTSSEYYTLNDIGEVSEQDNILRDNKTTLKLNPDFTNPKSYSYFGSLKEYFRVNIEDIIKSWPASIYVDKIFNTITGNTVENYTYNPITNKSNYKVNNNFFNNTFDIKYNIQFNDSSGLENKLRNLNVEYSRYTISYEGNDYPLVNFTGSTLLSNDYVYFQVEGNPFPLATGGTLSTNYHVKPNSVEVENFFSSLSDLPNQLLNRYIYPTYTINFNYLDDMAEGPYEVYVSRSFTWPVNDGYNLDIVTDSFDTYLTTLYEFCAYFDDNDTNIMNRRLVAESINRLNTIVRGDGSEDENDAEKVSKLINIYGREFDEVKKYIDGLSTIRTVTYNKNGNTPDTLVKDNAKTLGWTLLNPMSDVDLISSFIPNKPTYSGFSVSYSTYDAEIEFWRRLVVNTSHLWRSKGSRKAIEFIFDLIGTPQQLVSFNEYIYMTKKSMDINTFKLILKELTGDDDITIYNVDEDGYPKILPETPYNYYQSNGLWYRETSGSKSTLDVLEGNNPHIGPYDGGNTYIEQFKCLLDTFSGYTNNNGRSIEITNDYIEITNLFKNYSNGLVNNYNGNLYLDIYDINGKPNICFDTVGSQVITNPDPQNIMNICGCPINVTDKALMIKIKIKRYTKSLYE